MKIKTVLLKPAFRYSNRVNPALFRLKPILYLCLHQLWWNYSQFTSVSERKINCSISTSKRTNYLLCRAVCSKGPLSLSCRALFLPFTPHGSRGCLWFNCSNSQQSFPAPSDKIFFERSWPWSPSFGTQLCGRGRAGSTFAGMARSCIPGKRRVWEIVDS